MRQSMIARRAEKLLLQLAHYLRLAWTLVVMAEEVAQAVDCQARELAGKPPARGAAKGALGRDDDVAEKDAITPRIAFPTQLLLMEAEHVGGAVELAIAAVQRPDLRVAGQKHGHVGACAVEGAQGDAQAPGERGAGLPRHQLAHLRPNQQIDHGHITRFQISAVTKMRRISGSYLPARASLSRISRARRAGTAGL